MTSQFSVFKALPFAGLQLAMILHCATVGFLPCFIESPQLLNSIESVIPIETPIAAEIKYITERYRINFLRLDFSIEH